MPSASHFLAHAEGPGQPRCVAFEVQPGGALLMFDGTTVLQVEAEAALRAAETAVDHNSLVTFAPEPQTPPASAPRSVLLALRGA